MALKKNCESNNASVDLIISSKLEDADVSENISNVLDRYDILALDDLLVEAKNKISKLKKKNKKIIADLELMTQCFVEMVEKNDRLEEELKKFKKQLPLQATVKIH